MTNKNFRTADLLATQAVQLFNEAAISFEDWRNPTKRAAAYRAAELAELSAQQAAEAMAKALKYAAA